MVGRLDGRWRKTRPGRFELKAADHVVLTGEMDEAREGWEQRATPLVSSWASTSQRKRSSSLPATQPPCPAKRERLVTIDPIVTEDAFARMLGEMPQERVR